MDQQGLLYQAFLLGFIASREGFNGECAYDHCAPDSLADPRTSSYASVEEMLAELRQSEVLQKLWGEALERLKT